NWKPRTITVGDVSGHGDGVKDILFGDAKQSPNGRNQAGRVFLVFGQKASTFNNPVANFSFETPNIGTGNGAYTYDPGGATWTWGGDHNVGILGNGSAFGNKDAPYGTQAGFLQVLGSMSQSVTLGAGTYNVRFAAAMRNGQNQTIQVQIDGNTV